MGTCSPPAQSPTLHGISGVSVQNLVSTSDTYVHIVEYDKRVVSLVVNSGLAISRKYRP